MSKNVHTTYNHEKEKWQNIKAGNTKASSNHDTKNEAVNKGRDLAKNEGSEHKIHNQDGKISQSNSYGNDPYPPKDKK